MNWLHDALVRAELWPRAAPMSCCVVLRERFEVYLIRKPGRDEPCLVAKRARDEHAAVRLRHEHEFLRALASRAPNGLAGSFPVSYGCLGQQDLELWVRSGVSGTHPAYVDLRSFSRVSHWLAEFSNSGRSDALAGGEWLERLHAPPSDLSPRVSLAKEIAVALEGSIPSVWEHGDLNPGNVLLRPHSVAVIDWVWGRERGIPLFDWFDFCIHAALGELRSGAADHPWQDLCRAVLDHSSSLHTRLMEGARLIGRSLGADGDITRALLVFYSCTRLWSLIAFRSRREADAVLTDALRDGAAGWGTARSSGAIS